MIRLFLIGFLAVCNVAYGQNQDRIWIFGDSTGIDFTNLSNPVATLSSSSYSDENNSSICDKQGNLLFYLGGVADSSGYVWMPLMRVFNKYGEIMDNGDSIYSDYSQTNGLIVIPIPDDSNRYYLFHLKHINYHSSLYYSTIDMSYNNGAGQVITKNIPIPINLSDSLCEKLAAVKHGNGKDWWLVVHQFGSNRYYKFLITSNGIMDPIVQDIGSCFCEGLQFAGEMCFAKDGSKLLNVGFGLADVLSFDRCTGELDTLVLFNDTLNPDWPFYYGCSFSPSGRFAYISNFQDFLTTNNNRLFQLDLEAEDIISSKYIVYEGPLANYTTQICQHQLGPDNKIYICYSKGFPYYPFNVDSTNTYLSVINQPDSPGSLCNFLPFSFYMGGRQVGGGLPNMPNYNLGAKENAICDTIFDIVNEGAFDEKFFIYPNPSFGDVTLKIFSALEEVSAHDLLGHFYQPNQIEKRVGQYEIRFSNLPDGIYILRWWGNYSSGTAKFIVVR